MDADDRREYPKFKYHPELGARIVNDPDEEVALGPEWRESPADPVYVPPTPDPVEGEGSKKKSKKSDA